MRHDDISYGNLRRLGVHPAGDGVDVAVLASHADGVDLCLLDPDPAVARRLVRAPGAAVRTDLRDLVRPRPGRRAGPAVRLPRERPLGPGRRVRYNPAKLLVDPYARGLDGLERLATPRAERYGHAVGADHLPLPGGPVADQTDSRAVVPHSVVVADPGPAADTRPRVPMARTVVYEAHVKV